MTSLVVYDPAMCCSSGVCGPQVDPALVRFAADLKWAESRGVAVTRHNLGQEPQAFAANPAVLKEMEAGMDRLPVVVVDDRIVAAGRYPTREQLAAALGLTVDNDAGTGCCSPRTGCC